MLRHSCCKAAFAPTSQFSRPSCLLGMEAPDALMDSRQNLSLSRPSMQMEKETADGLSPLFGAHRGYSFFLPLPPPLWQKEEELDG